MSPITRRGCLLAPETRSRSSWSPLSLTKIFTYTLGHVWKDFHAFKNCIETLMITDEILCLNFEESHICFVSGNCFTYESKWKFFRPKREDRHFWFMFLWVDIVLVGIQWTKGSFLCLLCWRSQFFIALSQIEENSKPFPLDASTEDKSWADHYEMVVKVPGFQWFLPWVILVYSTLKWSEDKEERKSTGREGYINHFGTIFISHRSLMDDWALTLLFQYEKTCFHLAVELAEYIRE